MMMKDRFPGYWKDGPIEYSLRQTVIIEVPEMAAYFISDVSVREPDAFQIYRTRAAESISKHGGKYLVRGGDIETFEGEWAPSTIIIVEFPSLEHARSWYASPDYAFALEVRDKALARNLILVDGIGLAT
jgi:uncharacterized protein (DUF1330 family)